MSRLAAEHRRLYLLPPAEGSDVAPALVDAQGRVRAMVIEVARPAEWTPVAQLWQAVQRELTLPAPAIAVSGRDGYQLWFSLAQPLPAERARAFAEALCGRWLAGLPAARVGVWPQVAAGPAATVSHAPLVPLREDDAGVWSAFVAPDLAPMFEDEPWLGLPPSRDGQAHLLSTLSPIDMTDVERALAMLLPVQLAPPGDEARSEPPQPVVPASPVLSTRAAPAGGWTDPRAFLLDVMNDASAPLALRVEAARALIAHPAR